jgi:hypothetical protein
MTAQCFVDTNILVYAARTNDDEPDKYVINGMDPPWRRRNAE